MAKLALTNNIFHLPSYILHHSVHRCKKLNEENI